MGTDFRSMYDRDFIGAWDLGDKDVVLTIASVEAGTLTAPGGRKTKKPVVKFEGKEKGFALNKTNGKAIAGMYGNDTAAWIGKRIAIYATRTMFGSDEVECIRVRPTIPQGQRIANGRAAAKEKPPALPAQDRKPTDEEIAELERQAIADGAVPS